ncbi:hypothetical protein [Thiohalorhabdus sp.]|uniref:hypothetical protein n=1 Tax=Thiohalorhabdus sp. TaxID=3094134 RepID=UPI002FC2EF1C
MAATPPFKIFSPSGDYIASTKYAADAVLLAGLYGDGARVRWPSTGGKIIWQEGWEATSGAESADTAAHRVGGPMLTPQAKVHQAALIKRAADLLTQESLESEAPAPFRLLRDMYAEAADLAETGDAALAESCRFNEASSEAALAARREY